MNNSITFHKRHILFLLLSFSCLVLINDIISKNFFGIIAEVVFIVLHCFQIVLVIFFMNKNKLTWHGLFAKNKFYISVAILAFLLGLSINFFASTLDEIINNILFKQSLDSTSNNMQVGTILFFVFFACFIAPIFEEIEFRGLLFQALNNKKKLSLKNVFLVSLMFLILHSGSVNSGAFVMSILSCCLLFYSSSLVYSVILHFGGNFILLFLFVLSLILPSNEENVEVISSNILSFEKIMVLIILGLVVAVLGYFTLKLVRSKYRLQDHNCEYLKNESTLEVEVPVEKKNVLDFLLIMAYFVICIASWIILLK